MKQLLFSEEACNSVCAFEKEMLEEYKMQTSKYRSQFEKYNCELSVRLYWENIDSKIWGNNRLQMGIGYRSCVCCTVEREGRMVSVKSYDGEAEYYNLLVCWEIVRVERKWFKTIIKVFDDIDEIDDDLNLFLVQLESERIINLQE